MAIDGNKYKHLSPVFDPTEFFDGPVKAWGIVQDRSGNMVQQFTVDIDGQVTETKIVLDEEFHYLLGEGVTKRIWEIDVKDSDKAFIGKASDIEEFATGSVYGNAMRWEYSMRLPVGEKSYHVKFEDWMWAFDSERLMNRSYIKKFGLVMAEVTIFMQRQVPPKEGASLEHEYESQ